MSNGHPAYASPSVLVVQAQVQLRPAFVEGLLDTGLFSGILALSIAGLCTQAETRSRSVLLREGRETAKRELPKYGSRSSAVHGASATPCPARPSQTHLRPPPCVDPPTYRRPTLHRWTGRQDYNSGTRVLDPPLSTSSCQRADSSVNCSSRTAAPLANFVTIKTKEDGT